MYTMPNTDESRTCYMMRPLQECRPIYAVITHTH